MNSRKPIVLLALAALLALAVVAFLRWGTGGEGPATPTVVGGPEGPAAPAPSEEPSDLDAGDPASPDAPGSIARAPQSADAPRTADESPDESPEPEPEGPFLRGRVVDERGLPVGGAQVSVRAADSGGGGLFGMGARGADEAATEVDGTFALPRAGRDQAALRVDVLARGFVPFEGTAAPDREAGDARLGDFELRPGVVFEGVVLDADGRPVEGAKVRRRGEGEGGWVAELSELQRGGEGVANTDAEGRFTLAHEEPGEYVLVVRHEEQPEGSFPGSAPQPGVEHTGLVLRLAPSAAVTGRIEGFPAGREHVEVHATAVDEERMESGLPLEGLLALTGAGGPEAEVGPDGRFTVLGLAPGRRYRVQAKARAGLFGAQPCSDVVEAVAGGDEAVLTWEPGARVVLEARAAESGELLGETIARYRWVGAGDMPWENMTQEETFEGGRVVLGELRPEPAPGALELVVSAPGRLEQRYADVSVPAEGEVDLGVARLAVAPRLRVQVLELATGEPLRGARVSLRCGRVGADADGAFDTRFTIEAAPVKAKTDRGGWCELDVCAAAVGTLSVYKPRYARYELEDLALPTEGTWEQIVRLSSGGAIAALVVDTRGRPVQRASVIVRGDDEDTRTHTADDDGEAELEHLAAGRYEVRAERPEPQGGGITVQVDVDDEGETRWTEVEVVEGATQSVRLELPAAASVLGTVTSRGAPVTGARVRFLQGLESGDDEQMAALIAEQLGDLAPSALRSAPTDGRGRFELAAVPVGRHRLSVARGDGGLPQVFEVDLVDGENRVDLELAGASIEGRVVDADGRPIAGATVRAQPVAEGEESEETARNVGIALSLFGRQGKQGVTTGPDGRFAIESVSPEMRLVVEASARGYSKAESEPLELAEDERRRGVEIVLTGSGDLRVVVEGAQEFLSFVTATRVGEVDGGVLMEMSMVQDGEVVFRDLRPGTWRVQRGRGDDEPAASREVEVRPGEEALVHLDG